MEQVYGNIWYFHQYGPVCITTNSVIKKDGGLVMGAGIALQAKKRFPELPGKLADIVREHGNVPVYMPVENLFSFPTKNNWRDPSDIDLIRRSCLDLVTITNQMGFKQVFLPKPGCGKGQLDWNDVSAVINPILDDRFVLVLQ